MLTMLLLEVRFMVASTVTLVPHGSCCEKPAPNWCRRLLSEREPPEAAFNCDVLNEVSRLTVAEKRKEGCTTHAMDLAAKNGHLEVVRFLHENRREGCTIYAVNRAAENGHLEVVRFLHEHPEVVRSVRAMAAKRR